NEEHWKLHEAEADSRWKEIKKYCEENKEHWKHHEAEADARWKEYQKNRKADMEASFDAMMRHEIYIAEQFRDPNVEKMRKLL
ncbi:MAG: hypothetical protein IJ672_08815, partial [Methanobrevibacter sp.]|nr:hypothetical protein [Methanobrevibacter sp.]